MNSTALADTVYRCGEAYSTSSQCANAAATEVKPNSVLHTNGQDENNIAIHDLREAQSLEKQRMQSERQAAQSTPIRLNTPSLAPASSMSHDSLTSTPKRRGKHSRQPNSPYFTAMDPTAPKKKSTAKAVPAASNP